MNKQEDKLFEMYRDSFQGFEPEVPASIYAGVRKKMMWSNFMTFNLSTLNVWYLGILLLGGASALGYVSLGESMGQMTAQHEVLNKFEVPQLAQLETDCIAFGDHDDIEEDEAPAVVEKIKAPISVASTPKFEDKAEGPTNVDLADKSTGGEGDQPKSDPIVEVEIAEDIAPMEVIKPEVIVPFTVQNALQIEMNDLVSQINNPDTEKITMKLPVTLPATNR